MIHGFMVVMYGTKVYAIVVVWCMGMDYWHKFLHWFVFCVAWVYRYITAPS